MESASQILHRTLGAPAWVFGARDKNKKVVGIGQTDAAARAAAYKHDVSVADCVRHTTECASTDVATTCRLCGGESRRGRPYGSWGGAKYIGQTQLRALDSNWVCEACVCVCGWFNPMILPVPGIVMPEDNTRPPNWRSYSILFDAGGVRAISKGDKPAILAWLRSPKHGNWFAALTETGQKHTVPNAPVNPGDTQHEVVLFEDRVIAIGDWAMVDAISAFLTSGPSKEEVDSAEYKVDSVIQHSASIDAFEQQWGRQHRASPWWDLALWLAQVTKEEQAKRNVRSSVRKSKSKADERARRTPGQSAARVSRAASAGEPVEPDDSLGQAAERRPDVRANDEGSERVAVGHARPTADRSAVEGDGAARMSARRDRPGR
jgi:hypothetical protein